MHIPLKSKQDLKIKKRDDTGHCDVMQLLDIENDFYVIYKCPDSTVSEMAVLKSSSFMAVGSNPGKTLFLFLKYFSTEMH